MIPKQLVERSSAAPAEPQRKLYLEVHFAQASQCSPPIKD